MKKLKVAVDYFRGEVAPNEHLWCEKGQIIEVSDEAWENIKRDFKQWFILLEDSKEKIKEEKIEEDKMFFPEKNKMINKSNKVK